MGECMMTIEELREHKMNAIAILREEMEYDTAKAPEKAFDALIALEEIRECLKEGRMPIA